MEFIPPHKIGADRAVRIKQSYASTKLIMRKLILAFSLCLLCFAVTPAQGDRSWPPLEQLRQDYNSSTLVALVHFDKVEKEDELGGYVMHHVYCHVLKPYKGKMPQGYKLEYYVMAEKVYDMSGYKTDKIIFLQRRFNREKNAWRFSELENSWVDPTSTVLSKMNN